MSNRRGVSRVEVVVVLVCVALGGGLIAAGIVRVREAAARMSCQNNLKYLSMGALNYHNATNRFPPLTDPQPAHRSVFARLIPYLESTPHYYDPDKHAPEVYHAHSSVGFPWRNKFDGSEHIRGGGIANQWWNPFVDPTDATGGPLRDVPMMLADGSTGYYSPSSYAANGQFPWGRAIAPKSLAGWPAQMVMFAERPQVCRTATGDTVYNLWGVGFYSPHMPAFATRTPAEPPGLLPTGQLLPGDPEWGTLPLQVIRKGQPCDPRLPGTPHRFGMNAAMGDASVRLFARNTDPTVLWAAYAAAE